jgi:1-acyl-sn-glycerol-3-phosphate acyltransferase
MAYLIAKRFFLFLRILFVKKCTGLENIPKEGPFILVANHQTHLDGIVLGSYVIEKTNQKIHFFAKREFTEYFGKVFEKIVYQQWAGCLFVEKEGTKNKGEKAIQGAVRLLNKGGIVGIFPEGTRSYTGALLEGKTGIIRILYRTKRKIPIIPASIKNSTVMLPRKKIIPRIWKARMNITFGKPFYVTISQKMTKEVLRNKTAFVMNKIEELL